MCLACRQRKREWIARRKTIETADQADGRRKHRRECAVTRQAAEAEEATTSHFQYATYLLLTPYTYMQEVMIKFVQ